MSEATVHFGEAALFRLLQQARAEHEQAGLSGVLIYHEGRFLQVVEGPAAPVREFFARIAIDPRHCKLEVLADGPRSQGDFADWRMSFACPVPARCEQQRNYLSVSQLLISAKDTHVYPLLQEFLNQHAAPLY